MRIALKTGESFGFAGLWETWRSPEDEIVHSCTIITTAPNALIEPIHNRMPVIMPREVEAQWLDINQTDTGELRELLVPYSADDMEAYEVSQLVNSPRSDMPDIVTKVA